MLLSLVSLIIIIILHELSHLIAAKQVGCNVEVFSVGFGKPLFKKRINNTLFQIAPILLGGFCKLEGETEISESEHAFSNLKYRNKIIITIAGCVANIITGILAFKLFEIYNFNFLNIFSQLSILLGLSNLLPIPPLDGSYIFLTLLEKIKDKKSSYKLINKISSIGFIVIMTLNIICILAWIFIKAYTELILRGIIR